MTKACNLACRVEFKGEFYLWHAMFNLKQYLSVSVRNSGLSRFIFNLSPTALTNSFNLLCFISALMSLLFLSHHVSSIWTVTAPVLSSSGWQSRPTGSPLAQWQGVRVTPHWFPAYLNPTTHLTACVPTCPPPSAVLIRKGLER